MKSFIFIASINNEHKKTSLERGILPLWWGKMPIAWATYPNDIYNAMVHFAPMLFIIVLASQHQSLILGLTSSFTVLICL